MNLQHQSTQSQDLEDNRAFPQTSLPVAGVGQERAQRRSRRSDHGKAWLIKKMEQEAGTIHLTRFEWLSMVWSIANLLAFRPDYFPPVVSIGRLSAEHNVAVAFSVER